MSLTATLRGDPEVTSPYKGMTYLSQCVFIHVVLLHNVLQSKVDLLLELLDFPRLHQPRPI